MNDERGMTLVEVLVAIGLLAIVALVMFQITSFGMRAFARDEGGLLSLAAERSAVSRISNDTRRAVSAAAQSGGTALLLATPGGSIRYETDSAGDLIRRVNGGEPQTVVRGVGSITFSVEQRAKPGSGSWQTVGINVSTRVGDPLTVRVTVRRP